MTELSHLLTRAAAAAADYHASLPSRSVAPAPATATGAEFAHALGDRPMAPDAVIEELIAAADHRLVQTAGPRYFGFVIGGSLDVAIAADLLTSAWDQCAFNAVLSPAAAAAEEAAGGWLKEILGIPPSASVGFVTGGQEANTVGLAAGRHHVLSEAGWDVERDGIAGGPRVRVVASSERHATIDRALRLLGFGTAIVEPVATDGNGAVDPSQLAEVLAAGPDGPTIVCLQAGNVNTGACDDLRSTVGLARERGAWVHIDGAFGLWAAASPSRRRLVDGLELADSWACDGHKWLNVPYDSGFVFCSRPDVHARAVSYSASYLVGSGGSLGGLSDFTLASSRRARGFATWAALRHLGREGVAGLVDRACEHAERFADRLVAGGAAIANDVVLNQVLVDFGSDERTDAVIAEVQRDGVCWMGGTTWRGRRLMRISVSNWATTTHDVDLSVEAILRAAAAV